MAYGTINADLMTTSDGVSSSGLYGFKNRIINGAMVIDQRNAGASVNNDTSGSQYCVDRWGIVGSQSSKFSAQRSTTAPVGFINSLLITSLSAYSVGSTDYFQCYQPIEGLNVQDLGWGTSDAKTVTLSFWVRSSLTGTFGGTLSNQAFNRSYPFTYTISVANTFEYKTITIAGDTSGTWLTTNAVGMYVMFGLGAGSSASGTAGSWQATGYRSATGATSVVGTNGATFYITGVQLEKGSTATSFDYRPYGTELQLCQRYFEQWNGGANYASMPTGQIANGNSFAFNVIPFVFKRTTPTVSLSSLAGGTLFSAYGTNASGGTFPWSGNITVDTGGSGNLGVALSSALTGSSAGGAGTCVNIILRANQYIQFSAEL